VLEADNRRRTQRIDPSHDTRGISEEKISGPQIVDNVRAGGRRHAARERMLVEHPVGDTSGFSGGKRVRQRTGERERVGQ
jgi:hypothetical protein